MTDFKVVFDIQAKGGDAAAAAVGGVNKAIESTDKAVKSAAASMRTLDAGLEKSKQQWAQFAASGGQSISTLDSAVKKYRDSWAAFGVTSSNVARVFDSQSSSMRSMDTAGKSAYSTLKQLEAQQKAVAKAAADATAQMAKLGTESSRAWSKGASGLSINGMAQLSSGAKQAAEETKKAKEEVSWLGKEINKLGAVMLGAFAIDRIVAFGGEIVRTAAQMETLQKGFEAVTGSSALASKEMDFVLATANRLGLELQGAARSYLGLEAASKGSGLEGEKTREIYVAVSKAMAALGRTSDDTQGALLAIGQMMSKGSVQSEELRGQLGERLPGAFNLAAQAMGVTTGELQDMLQKGEVVAADFLPRLASVLDSTYSSARFDGINNNINRMSTEWTLLKNNIADTDVINGAINFITTRLRVLNSAFAQSASSAAAWKEMVAGMSQTGNRLGLAQQLAEEQNKLNQLMANQKANPNGSVFTGQIEEQRKKVSELNQALLGLNQTQAKSGEVQSQAATHSKKYAQAMGAADQAIAQSSKNWKAYYTIAAQQLGLTGKEVDEYVAKMVRSKKIQEEASAGTKAHGKAMSEAAKEAKQLAKDQQSAVDAASNFIKALKDELAAVESYSDAAQFEAKLREATKDLTEKQAEAYTKNAIALKQQIEAAQFEADREKESITYTMRLSDEYEKQTAVLVRLTEAKNAGASPEYLAQLKQELDALAAIPDSVQGSAREFAERTTVGLQQTNAAIGQLTEDARQKVSTLQDEMGQYMTQAARNMQSSLADYFFDPFSDQTESMGTKFVTMLRRMGAELASSMVLRFLTGNFSSNGQLGGLLGGVGSFLGFGGASAAMAGTSGVVSTTGVPITSVNGTTAVPVSMVGNLGTGLSAVSGTGSMFGGMPAWMSSAAGWGGAGLGGAGLGYLIGGAIGSKNNQGQAGGTLGGLAGGLIGYSMYPMMAQYAALGLYSAGVSGTVAGAGAAAAGGSALGAMASTGIGAIVAAVIAAIAANVKVGQPDAKLIANVNPGEGYDITTLESRHGGQGGIWGLLNGIARTLDPIGRNTIATKPNEGAWAPGEKFLGDALKGVFAPLGKLEQSLGVMIPAFQFVGRIHNGFAGIQIPGMYSARMKFDDNAGQYMQQAVSIATMRLLQQPAVLNQMTDPVTKATVQLSGDLQTFSANLEKVAGVRKYAGGGFDETGGRKVLGKALDLSGGDIDQYVQNMKELGSLRTFLGEWTPDVGAWIQTVDGFDAMEKAAIKFGVSVKKVSEQIDKTIQAQQFGIQDQVNQLLGKPQSTSSKLFAANQTFDQLGAKESGTLAELAQYNKEERIRGKNALAQLDVKTFNGSDRQSVKSMLDRLKDPKFASDPAMLAEWQAGWNQFWENELAQAESIKNPKKRKEAIAKIKALQQQTDPHATEQIDIEAARAQYVEQQKKAILDQAQAYAGQGASQYAAKIKEINDFFSDANQSASELGISTSELAGYQKKATAALRDDFNNALKQFAGETVSGAAAALKSIDDQEKTFEKDAAALGISLDKVHDAAEKARQKLKDDFVKSLDSMAGVLDTNTQSFNALSDQFKTLYEDAQTLGVGMDKVGAALVQSMKNLWEQMTAGIVSARQAIAQQIAELQGPQAVATLAGQNVDTAQAKLADYYASGGNDVNKEIALIQGVQSAVMARYNAELALIQETIQKEVEAIQAKAQAEVDAVNETLNVQIEAENERLSAAIEAENERLNVVVEAESERLNAQIEAINAASQAQVDAIQEQADAAAEARQEAQQAELDALSEQLQVANQLKSTLKNIADYAKSLATAPNSPLSPEERYKQARAQYEATAAAAPTDAEAAARYQQDAEAFRAASEAYNASNAQYAADYAKIQADATRIGNTVVTSPDSIESQMKELRKQQATENKEAQKLVQEQIKAVQQGAQDQIKAAQEASQDYVKSLQDASKDTIAQMQKDSQAAVEGMRDSANAQIKSIQAEADKKIKAAQDLDSRPDVQALKKDTIAALELLDKNLATAYENAQKQYQTFIDALAGVVGSNTTAIAALVDWLNKQGVAVTQPQTKNTIIQVNADGSQTTIQEGNSGTTEYLPPPHYAAGGVARQGWALVGELGPELVNFDRPGRVYTAADTAQMMAGLNAANDSDAYANFVAQQSESIAKIQEWIQSWIANARAANDAHGAYANVLDMPPTAQNAWSAVQSLMLKPAQTQELPDYIPAVVERQTARLEERLARIESGQGGQNMDALKSEIQGLKTEFRALVMTQADANPKLVAYLQALLARFEDMVSEVKLARRA